MDKHFYGIEKNKLFRNLIISFELKITNPLYIDKKMPKFYIFTQIISR